MSSGTRTLWDEGHEPGHELVALGLAVAFSVAAVDVGLSGHVSSLFDAGFVTLCLGLALAVRPGDFFTVGVLPPLLMLATFLMLALSRAQDIDSRGDSVPGAVIGGLGHHSLGLALAYLGCLGVLATRQRMARRQHPGPRSRPADDPAVSRTGRGPRLPV